MLIKANYAIKILCGLQCKHHKVRLNILSQLHSTNKNMLGCAFNHHYHDENVVKRLFYGLRSFLSQASILTVLTPDSTYERYKRSRIYFNLCY